MKSCICPIRAVTGGVTAAKGFRAAGVPAQIKQADRKDVMLLVADEPCATAAMFTTNAVAAAPVIYDRPIAASGKAQAIVANSGCANACTGQEGLKDAEKSAAATAAALGIDKALVMVASTGVIGRRLPMNRLLEGIKSASQQLDDSLEAGLAANMATLTTDTRPKQAAVRFSLDGKTVTVGGMIKGSGMIAPNMATMLGFITTDAAIAPSMLRRALAKAVSVSFNRLVVDGDMSTNDSVFVMASGKAGNAKITKADERYENFAKALTRVCIMLTKQMAADGEGATKFVMVTVKGAKTQSDAERAAQAIARSPLAKTSWFGKDPNWGRVLAAAGYSGAMVDDSRAEVYYGKAWAYRRGAVADAKQLEKLAKELSGPELTVTVNLRLGNAEATVYTCDLSLDYVHINADYTT